MSEDEPVEVAVTGSGWMGRGTGSIWRLIEDAFSKCENEILIATYSVTEGSDFFKLLEDALTRKTRITIIINRFETQKPEVQEKFKKLALEHSSLILKNFDPKDNREDLHAKLIVIDHSIALVGSANLTFKGMVMNHELMVKLTGETANSVGGLLDRLSKHPECRTIGQEGV